MIGMNAMNTKIIVPRNEAIHTKKGHRINEMQMKGVLFNKLWPILRNETNATMHDIITTEYKKIETIYIPYGMKQSICDDMYKYLFNDTTKIYILKVLEANGADLMFDSDERIQEAFIKFIQTNENISSMNYLKSLMYSAHSAFYNMGREHMFSDNNVIKVPYIMGDRTLMNSGNPITNSLKQAVFKLFGMLKDTRDSKFMVTTKNGENKKSVKKTGLAASVAVVIYITIGWFKQLLNDLNNGIKDVRRIENLVNIILFSMFSMHEGCRCREIINFTTHQSLYFSFGEQYSLLCLAFVKPKTLAYLLSSGYLNSFVCDFYKGKSVKHARSRLMSWKPIQYNIIDLATMYVILMRILLCIDSKTVKSKLIFKKGINLADHVRRRNIKQHIFGFVNYSIRYGAAEEDFKYGIPADWTRYRMGHSEYSLMKNRYANNLNQRVIIDEVMSLLGCDVMTSHSDDSIPLKMVKVNGSIIHKAVPSDVPQHIIQELTTIKSALDEFFTEDKEIADISELIQRIPSSREMLFAELKEIPLGSFIDIKRELLSQDMHTQLSSNLKFIHEFFSEVQKPDVIPMIWSYPQLMYGIWTDNFKESTKQEWNQIKAQEVITEIKGLLFAVDGPIVEKRSKEEVFNVTTNNSKKVAPIVKRRKIKHTKNEKDIMQDKNVRNLKIGDVVIAVCEEDSCWSIKIPYSQKVVWVCYVNDIEQTIQENWIKVTGVLYKGTLEKLLYSKKDVFSIDLNSECIVGIIKKEQVPFPDKLKFDKDDVESIVQRAIIFKP
jgi:hypothetical protein